MVRKTCGNLMGMGKIALVACVAAVGLAGFADEIDWNAISEYVTLEKRLGRTARMAVAPVVKFYPSDRKALDDLLSECKR